MGIREDWNDKILIFDGGMGSLLQGAGLKPGELGREYYFIEYIRREPPEIQ